MGQRLDPDVVAAYYTNRQMGLSVRGAAIKAGLSPTHAYRIDKNQAPAVADMTGLLDDPTVTLTPGALALIPPDAQRALADFGYFRQRYFGRRALPWAVDLANALVQALTDESNDPDGKHYMVANMPPGVGKTTLLRDIIIWLICRNRDVRILWGSRTESQAKTNVQLIRDLLAHPGKLSITDAQRRTRGSTDPEGSLVGDFGRFRPDKHDGNWGSDRFTVIKHGGAQTMEKEDTLSAYGIDSGVLGSRVDLALWDDLVDQKNYRTAVTLENLIEKWDSVLESRVEPGGLVLLLGQRLNASDLYRHCVSADALTITKRGAVPLRDVTTDDHVLTRDGYKRVLWSGSQGIRPTLKITTDLGRTLDLTPDHKVAVGSEWSRADALPTGARLVGAPLGLDLRPVGSASTHPNALLATAARPLHRVGVLNGVGMPLVAVGASGVPTDHLRPPLVAPMILTNEVLGSNTRRATTQVAGLTALREPCAPEVEVTHDHARDELLTAVGRVCGDTVAPVVHGSLPDQALAIPFTSGQEPCHVEGLLRPAEDTLRSITHSAMIETWDLTVEDTPEFYANGILVHNCLDKVIPQIDAEGNIVDDAEPVAQYAHICFPAHDDDKCLGDHTPKTALPWPAGCLLDPRAVTWRELSGKMLNNPLTYSIVYQQRDGDGTSNLVDPAWIYGDTDPNGVSHVGCVDRQRILGQHPPYPHEHRILHVGSVDPSGVNSWGILRCAWDPIDDTIHIIDIFNGPLTAGQVLDRDETLQGYSGLMEEWQTRSIDDRHRITHWIFEKNTTQRWFYQYNHARDWQRVRSTQVVPHTTNINKLDETKGIEMLRDYFRYGRVRIPYGDQRSQLAAKALIQQATKYPSHPKSDLLMSLWFVAFNAPKIQPTLKRPPVRQRPSWLRSVA